MPAVTIPGTSRWRFRLVLTAATAFLAAAVVSKVVNASPRGALWQVVSACLANYDMTRSPFPCLAVNLEGGASRGFVLLRPPIGPPDTILTPARPVVGIEDPALSAPGAPNYFADAWNSLSFVEGASMSPDAAVGVNSQLRRSQDQFHVHIGCLKPQARKLVARAAAAPAGVWTRAQAQHMPGQSVWTLALEAADVADFNPIAEAMRLESGGDSLALITLVVARNPNRPGFTLLAVMNSGETGPGAVEYFVSTRCGV